MVSKLIFKLKVMYYTVVLWLEDFGTDAKSSNILPFRQPVRETRNDKLARGVRHLVRWMRGLTPEEREELIRSESNILMKAGTSRKKGTLEKMEEAKAASKLVAGPREESESSMADTFVKNQRKYQLQARLRALHKEALRGGRPALDIRRDIEQIKRELKQRG
jgi:hypothetical protein